MRNIPKRVMGLSTRFPSDGAVFGVVKPFGGEDLLKEVGGMGFIGPHYFQSPLCFLIH